MKRPRMNLIFLFFITFYPPSIVFAKNGGDYKVLLCNNLFNSENGVIQKDRVVIIKGGFIEKVWPSSRLSELKPNMKIISQKWCIPGLIDTHVHFEQTVTSLKFPFSHPDESYYAMQAVSYAKDTLESGFTTVRDLISDRNVAFVLKDLILLEEAGQSDGIVGPGILAAGPAFGPQDGHGDFFNKIKIDGRPNALTDYITYYVKKFVGAESDVKSWFDYYFEEKPNWYSKFSLVKTLPIPDTIKIMATGGVLSSNANGHKAQLDLSTIMEAVDETRKWEKILNKKIPIAAHTHGFDGVTNVVTAGVDSIEHASELFVDLNEDAPIDPNERKSLVKEIAAKGIFLSPTLAAAQAAIVLAEKLPEPIKSKALKIGPKLLQGFEGMAKASKNNGVRIVFGSDTGVSKHGENWHEFIYMVAYSKGHFSATEAVQSATYVAANSLGLGHQIGQIKEGYQADIIGFTRNPFKVIENNAKNIDTEKYTSATGRWPVSFVMKKGQIYKNNIFQ